MAKERDKIELRTVDEEAENAQRYVRLHPDNVEEVEELPPVRVGAGFSPEAKEAAGTGKRIKTRSNEPDIGSLIEREEIVPDAPWSSALAPRRRLPWGWIALVGCIFGGSIIWSLVAVKRSDKKQVRLVDQTEKIIESSLQSEKDAKFLVAGIEAAVRGFLGAKSVGEMAKFVRQPERIAPLMGIYYGETPPVPAKLKKILGLAPLTIDNRATFWVASFEQEDGQVAQLLVEAASEKDARVDWETYVNYQPMPWDEFAKSRPGGYTGDFRVYVEPDNFYSHEFADSEVYSSFRLTSLRGEEVLNGYTPRGGALEKTLTETIGRNGGGATPVILRLHLPEGLATKRGVVVEEMVCPRWVFLDNPEETDP